MGVNLGGNGADSDEGAAADSVDSVDSGRTDSGEGQADVSTEDGGTPSSSSPDAARPSWWNPIDRFETGGRRFLAGVRFPVAVWGVWRVVHFVITYLQVGPVSRPLIEALNTTFNYDGERYMTIMHQGYANANTMMPNTAFFPMVSWLASPIWWLTRSEGWTAHIVASLTAIAAFTMVWAVTREWRNEFVARRAVLLLACMPSSLYLWAFYSEGLFMALGAGAVVADRRNKHWLAAALFAPLAATRSVGILIPAVIILARIIRHRRLDRWCALYVAGASLGLAAVLVVMWKQVGDPLAWTKVQGDWGRNLSWPWATVNQGIDNLYPTPKTIMIPALVARNFDIWSLGIVGVPLFASMGTSAWARNEGRRMWVLGWSCVLAPLYIAGIVALSRFDIVGPAVRLSVPATKHVMTLPYLYLGIFFAMVAVLWVLQPLIPRLALRNEGWPMETWMLGWVLIALPLSSTALASFNRFALANWMLYPIGAGLLTRVPRKVRWIGYVVFGVAGLWVTYLMVGRFAANRFVG